MTGPTVVDAAAPGALDAAAARIASGGVVALPTDTVYGLAVDPTVPGAVELVFELKERPSDRPVAVLVSRLSQARGLVHFDDDARLLADWFWPGALTLVLARRPGLDLDLGDDQVTIGVRLPDHAVPRSLAARVGPLAVSSANRHGRPTPATADGVAREFAAADVMVLDGGPCPGRASTVARLVGGEVEVLREGALPGDQLRVALATRYGR